MEKNKKIKPKKYITHTTFNEKEYFIYQRGLYYQIECYHLNGVLDEIMLVPQTIIELLYSKIHPVCKTTSKKIKEK